MAKCEMKPNLSIYIHEYELSWTVVWQSARFWISRIFKRKYISCLQHICGPDKAGTDAPPRKPKFTRSGKRCILTQTKIFFKPNRGTFDIQTKPSNGFNGLFIKNNKKWCVAQSRVPGVSNEMIYFMLMSVGRTKIIFSDRKNCKIQIYKLKVVTTCCETVWEYHNDTYKNIAGIINYTAGSLEGNRPHLNLRKSSFLNFSPF